mmetsp:Transcript_9379/g.38491  ORF Transcript_9379/g.38491 Transcript_9379/m.38491 type:complete len:200 (+) Transcript_9379:592-1191(+)
MLDCANCSPGSSQQTTVTRTSPIVLLSTDLLVAMHARRSAMGTQLMRLPILALRTTIGRPAAHSRRNRDTRSLSARTRASSQPGSRWPTPERGSVAQSGLHTRPSSLPSGLHARNSSSEIQEPSNTPGGVALASRAVTTSIALASCSTISRSQPFRRRRLSVSMLAHARLPPPRQHGRTQRSAPSAPTLAYVRGAVHDT